MQNGENMAWQQSICEKNESVRVYTSGCFNSTVATRLLACRGLGKGVWAVLTV